MAPQVFAVPVFLVVFRETLETVIIVSVLLAWLKQTLDGPGPSDAVLHKRLRRQVWFGVGLGFLICLVVAAAVIGTFYTVGVNHWETSELYYEGAFSLFAALIITVVGAALLRISRMQDKWRHKLAAALDGRDPVVFGGGTRLAWLKRFSEKYALFVLPFITVLREGIEAIVFVAGVSFTAPASAFPLPAVVGLAVGILVGYILYKGGSSAQMQVFLVVSTCLLYLVAAGLFSRSVGYFEQQKWNNIIGGDAAELGNGPGTYDIDKTVWHVNCCSPELNGGGGWGIFNAILGWNNTATYGTVISYNLYWLAIITAFLLMRFKETKGHYPFLSGPPKKQQESMRQREPQAGGGGGSGGSVGSTSSVSRSEEAKVGGRRGGDGDDKEPPASETKETHVVDAPAVAAK